MLPLNFFSLCLSFFSLFIDGLFVANYLMNCLFEGYMFIVFTIFTMHVNHLSGHNHIPFVGYYIFVSIRNAGFTMLCTMNPARPIIIKFKSHICLGQSPGPLGGPCAPLWGWGRSWDPSIIFKQSNKLSFSHPRITSLPSISRESF